MFQSFKNIVIKLLVIAFLSGAYMAFGAESMEDKLKFAGDRIQFKLDFRYRHEQIDKEGYDMRTRHRFRGRIGIFADLTEEIQLGFQLASGSSDPLSTNQSLDSSFASKDVKIDLAYFDYHPEKIKGLNLIGGKMKNLFQLKSKSELIWDSDLRPEGLAFKYKTKFEPFSWFINGGGFWLEERSANKTEDEKNDNDSGFFGVNTGIEFDLQKIVDITFGIGYYHFIHMGADQDQMYSLLYDNEDDFGNSSYEGYYIHDYEELEIFTEIDFKVREIPVMIFGDFVKNFGVDQNNWSYTENRNPENRHDEDIAWLAGFKIGKCKEKNSWEIKYNYRIVEADAVVGALTDSDFRGGGTDAKGHEIGVGWQIIKYAKLGFTFFHNEIGIDLLDGEEEINYKRYQLDLQFTI